MISLFTVHLTNFSYLVKERLERQGLDDTAVVCLEQFIGADKQKQVRVWYRKPESIDEQESDY